MNVFCTADTLCICSCCDKNDCLSVYNSTFAIETCNSCTKLACEERYKKCHDANDIFSKCIDRDSIWNQLTIYIFLITVAILSSIAFLHEKIPMLSLLVS